MPKIITVSIQKGGIGKTTTAAALAQAAAARGLKVLAIDLDPQGNLSFALGAKMTGPGSYEFIHGTPAADAIQHTAQGVDVLRASFNLAALISFKGSARRLQEALKPIQDKYNAIFIDVPTMPGELQYNALQASTGILLPIEADVYNIQSVYQTIDVARQIQKTNPALKIEGIVFTKYNGRTNIAKQMREAATRNAEEMNVPFLGVIRFAIVVQEAAAFQESLFKYAPKSNPAADYMALFDRLYNE